MVVEPDPFAICSPSTQRNCLSSVPKYSEAYSVDALCNPLDFQSSHLSGEKCVVDGHLCKEMGMATKRDASLSAS